MRIFKNCSDTQKKLREMSEKYMPVKIRFLLICESPPLDSSNYFYCEEDRGKQVLFATIIKAFYDYDYKNSSGNKKIFLERLKEDGVFLIDAVEYPINRYSCGTRLNEKEKILEIKSNIPSLLNRLQYLTKLKALKEDSQIILISKNIHLCLYSELLNKKFNVLNSNPIIFPRYYRDKNTVNCISSIIAIEPNK